MALPDIHPELKTVVGRTPKITFKRWSLPILRRLIAWTAKSATSPAVSVSTVKDNGVTAHVYRPTSGTPAGALLWFHGGGYIVGVPKMEAAQCVELAERLNLLVVTPKYRLAPEHPFPAAHDDGHAAYHWLRAMLDNESLTEVEIVVGGESAGGGLAAGLVQRLVDESNAPPASGSVPRAPVAQLLIYPMLDDATAADRSLDDAGHALWNNKSNYLGWSAYLNAEPGGQEAPTYAVPARRTSVGDLPPTWIGVGNVDLFYDECYRYAERLEAESVPSDFVVVAGGVHGFDALDRSLPVSRSFFEGQVAFLHRVFGAKNETARNGDEPNAGESSTTAL